uniref:Uncharacterized protein n=1 Tax=Caenorhabditis japonica TaxID=281687 RepID=A0A8R1HTA0_CAEJA
MPKDHNESSMMTSSIRNDSQGLNDSEEWADAAKQFAMFDASVSRRYLNTVKLFSEQLEKSKEHKIEDLFEPNLNMFGELDDQNDDTPDEMEFKKLCAERANSSHYPPGSKKSDFLDWPGDQADGEENETQQEPSVVPSTYPEQNIGSTCLVELEEDEEWVWPSKPPLGETETVTETRARPENVWVDDTESDLSYLADAKQQSNTDTWADFSSFPNTNPGATTWPGSEARENGENSDWPLNSCHDPKPSDPATVGLAASISHPQKEKETDSSEA